MTKLQVLSVANLSPIYMEAMQAHYTVHQRLHDSDPAEFARVAPGIVAIAASGESKVGAALMDQLPALKIISVMGVTFACAVVRPSELFRVPDAAPTSSSLTPASTVSKYGATTSPKPRPRASGKSRASPSSAGPTSARAR